MLVSNVFKQIYRLAIWYFINIISFGKASKIYYINPSTLKHGQNPTSQFSAKTTLNFIKNGEWDKDVSPIEEHFLFKSFQDRFTHKKKWKETLLYKEGVSRVEKGLSFRTKYTTKEGVLSRCFECEDLYKVIKHHGIKSNHQLYKERKIDNPILMLDEITVNIDKNGQLILNDGWHRFLIAKILNLPLIPVRVLIRHTLWKGEVEEIITRYR
ncbi:hypothetical protein OMAG_000738 [Candidatus Omnitrophus magneticus]|uniref:ParB/Sulfiredoxin domain-containing protein n=1 Tax=Candidatus Omnitrophus magneticus TaxID=1609969 RepID=A0A0F0CQ11_9BACT|nr:hypothetical protein OMAG_000738 [Candidatus Omnitrophus magneticus]